MLFISYSSAERDLAIRLQEELTAHHVDVWLDIGRFPVGEEFVGQLASGLNSATRFLCIDSASSRASYWAGREVAVAVRLRRHGLMNMLARLCVGDPGLSRMVFDRTFSTIADATNVIAQLPQAKRLGGSPDGNVVHLTNLDGRHLPRSWYGFSDVLLQLDTWVTDGTRGFWISGPPASGKSSLASVWLAANQQLGYSHDRAVDIQLWSHGALRRASSAAARARLRRLSPDVELLVCVDGLEEFGWSDAEWLEVLSELMSVGARVLVTSRETPRVLSGEFTHVVLRALRGGELRLLLQDSELDSDGVDRIVDRAQGNPLYVATLKDQLKTGMITIDELVRYLQDEA